MAALWRENWPSCGRRCALAHMSGYTGFRDAIRLEPQAPLLPKPFRRDDLLAKLRETMSLEVEPQTVS